MIKFSNLEIGEYFKISENDPNVWVKVHDNPCYGCIKRCDDGVYRDRPFQRLCTLNDTGNDDEVYPI